MSVPDPRRGLVFNYAYLWSEQQADGQTEGLKNRPCVVMGLSRPGPDQKVYVCPITHSQPADGEGVEIPHDVKQRLGLDEKRSWINTSEMTSFDWKSSPDFRPVPGSQPPRCGYGMLPSGLSNAATKNLKAGLQQQQVKVFQRASDTQDAEYRSGRAAGSPSAERMRALTAPLSPEEQRAWNEKHPEQEHSLRQQPDLSRERRR